MDAILPAAGMATRMRGIPKFLLPCDPEFRTLIEVHIENLLNCCEQIWIPIRPQHVIAVESLGIINDRVILLPMQTQTMTETILKSAKISRASRFQLVMPDTFFFGELPYLFLSESKNLVDLACWTIRDSQKGKLGQVNAQGNKVIEIIDKDPNCVFPLAWGAMVFSQELLQYAKVDHPHVGYAVKSAISDEQAVFSKRIDGQYFDCGTPKEYLEMLTTVLVSKNARS